MAEARSYLISFCEEGPTLMMDAMADKEMERVRQAEAKRQKNRRIGKELEAWKPRIAPPRDGGFSSRNVLVLEDIHTHLFDPDLNVAAVRRRCDLRDNNASTRFREAVGLGIRDYIEKARIEAARHLLAATGAEVYLVAEGVGYDHPETFCRAFQRQLGMTPSEYRASLGP